MTEENRFRPHSFKQQTALFTKKPILALASGTQWGKTQVGGIRMKMKMHTFTESTDNFLVTAPNYKIMQQSTLPSFLAAMAGFGTYKASLAEFVMNGGGTCYFRTETDPDSIVGIPRVRHIWGDEAGKYGLYFWENIQNRADSVGATIDLTTSPYARNWIYHQLIKPALDGKRADIELVQAASWENPYHSLHDPEWRAQRRATMDPRRFDMSYGGTWGAMAGLVFDCFDEDKNVVEPFQLPTGTIYIGGVDWGYTEPFVHVVRAITPDGRHYQVSEFYKSGMKPHECIDLIEQKTKTFGIKRHWCGHEQPGMIDSLNAKGITAQAANFEIMKPTGVHYELIQSRRYKVFKGTSPHTLDEYSMYHYPEPEDLSPDDNAKEQKPVGQHDHAMSANRFISVHEARSELKLTPRAPGEKRAESQDARINRLKRPGRESGAETWD